MRQTLHYCCAEEVNSRSENLWYNITRAEGNAPITAGERYRARLQRGSDARRTAGAAAICATPRSVDSASKGVIFWYLLKFYLSRGS